MAYCFWSAMVAAMKRGAPQPNTSQRAADLKTPEQPKLALLLTEIDGAFTLLNTARTCLWPETKARCFRKVINAHRQISTEAAVLQLSFDERTALNKKLRELLHKLTEDRTATASS